MDRIVHRPFFSREVVIIAALVIVLGVLLSQGLVAILLRLLVS